MNTSDYLKASMSRRSFLQLMGIGSAGVCVGSQLAGCGLKKGDDPYNPFPVGIYDEGEWIPSGCAGCTTWCPVTVNLVKGRATKVNGHPLAKTTAGAACSRSNLAIQQLYDPDRIRFPMKRTNPRKGKGEDPGFVQISWDEAMDIIADKIMELRQNEEIHKLAIFRGRYTAMNQVIYNRVPEILGSPNNISHSSICAEAEKFGPYYTEGYWNYRDYDLKNSKYVLCWGVDPIHSNRQVSLNNRLWAEVLDKAKVAVIDPKFNSTAAKAHEWLPVIPGQDGALAVAMAHVILTKGLWSREFVGEFKDGANLFVAGQTVDEDAFEERESNGVVRWWNLELKDRTPEWAAELSGIPVEQIVRVATEFADNGPRACVFMGGGAVMQIRGAYNSMAIHALAGLVGSVDNVGGSIRGVSTAQQNLPDAAPFVDSVATEGRKYPKIDQRGYKNMPALNGGRSGGGVVTNRVADAILDEDPYDTKMILAYWCNFNFSCPDTKRWDKAMEKPFLVHMTLNYAEMSHFADILLPATHHMFEQWGYLAQKGNTYNHVWLSRPMIKPFTDSKNPELAVTWLLAEKLAARGFSNLLDYFKTIVDPETGKAPTDEQTFELYATKFRLQPIWDPAMYKEGDRFGGWEDFVRVGVWNNGPYPFKRLWGGKFGTATGKFEFYSETLKKAMTSHAERHKATVDEILAETDYLARGEQAFVPHYEEPLIRGDATAFPLLFIDSKSRMNREGRSANCTWYQELRDLDIGDEKWSDVIKIHPSDARRYRLATGDDVRVISPVGEIRCKLKVFQGVRPGTACKTFGQGHWAFGRVAAADFEVHRARGGNNNTVIPADYERLSGSTAYYGNFRVRIERV
jgi:anaerobic selenocysteine-containing dehydrogenase